MSNDPDYLFALRLQEEYQRELMREQEAVPPEIHQDSRKRKHIDLSDEDDNLNATQNIVHPEWEVIDPTPDIFSMFGAFDTKFFQGCLRCVTLEWSKRMFSCAGICYSRRNRLGMQVTIRLSEPLLKLRARKDLVETLLHEMIHAYLFVKNIREGNGGHGPNFKKIMLSINTVAGTNITVYHNFHDEVRLYKNHVWRCNGLCQHRSPFFGYVRRSCNRAPGPNDQWWAQHEQTCAGYFKKVSEPAKKTRQSKDTKTDKTQPTPGIKKYFGNGSGGGTVGATKNRGGSTFVVRKPPLSKEMAPPGMPAAVKFATSGNLANVVGFKDLQGESPSKKPNFSPTGPGHKLTQGSGSGSNTKPPIEKVRDAWSKRFAQTTSTQQTHTPEIPIKDEKPTWTVIDSDLSIIKPQIEHIDLLSDSDDSDVGIEDRSKPQMPPTKMNHNETTQAIKKEILEDSDDEDDIEMIDDEYDDDLAETTSTIGDTTIVDDFFGEDTLLTDFKKSNDLVVRGSSSSYTNRAAKEIICCPLCQGKMNREMLSEHLDGCGGIIISIKPKASTSTGGGGGPSGSSKRKRNSILPFYNNKVVSSRTVLIEAGYTENDIAAISDIEDDTLDESNEVVEATGNNDVDVVPAEDVNCPVCSAAMRSSAINDHLDQCLSGNLEEE